MVLTSRSKGSKYYLYGDATICAGLFDYVLIKREVAPSTAEHHTQEWVTHPQPQKEVCHNASRITDAFGWEWRQTEVPEDDELLG